MNTRNLMILIGSAAFVAVAGLLMFLNNTDHKPNPPSSNIGGFDSPEEAFAHFQSDIDKDDPAGLLPFLPPEERAFIAYSHIAIARFMLSFSAMGAGDEAGQSPAAKEFKAIIQKHDLGERLGFQPTEDVDEMIVMTNKAFEGVDLKELLVDISEFTDKQSGRKKKKTTGKINEWLGEEAGSEMKEKTLSIPELRDVKIEGTKAIGTRFDENGKESIMVFKQVEGRWYYSFAYSELERTKNPESDTRDSYIIVNLIITFDKSEDFKRADRKLLMKDVLFKRDKEVEIEKNEEEQYVVLSFCLTSDNWYDRRKENIDTILTIDGVKEVQLKQLWDYAKLIKKQQAEKTQRSIVSQPATKPNPFGVVQPNVPPKKSVRPVQRQPLSSQQRRDATRRMWEARLSALKSQNPTLDDPKLLPQIASINLEISRLYSAEKNWGKAALHAEKSYRAELPKTAADWFDFAKLYLLEGKEDQFKELIHGYLAQTSFADFDHMKTRLNMLAPNAFEDQADLVRIADEVVVKENHNIWYQLVQAVTNYRAGNFQVAKQQLENIRFTKSSDKWIEPLRDYWLALSYLRSEEKERAQYVLHKADVLKNRNLSRWSWVPDYIFLPEITLLQREAYQEINGTHPPEEPELIALNPSNPFGRSTPVQPVQTQPKLRSVDLSKLTSPDAKGWSLTFDGQSSRVTAPHIPFDQYQAFTLEAWVRGWQSHLITQGLYGDPENSVWLAMGTEDSAHATCGWESGSGTNYQMAAGSTASLLNWNHIALVYDGKDQALYVNGQLVQKRPVPGPRPLVRSRHLIIGVHDDGDRTRNESMYGSGQLGPIRISSIARYSKSFTPKQNFETDTDTVLLYNLTEGQGTRLVDVSGNKRNGIISGAKWQKANQVYSLNLAETNVTDQSLAMLENMEELKILSLYKTGISNTGLAYLKGLSSLRSLDIRETGVTSAGVTQLKEALPECEISSTARTTRIQTPSTTLDSLTAAIKRNPSNPVAYKTRGELYARQERWKEAADDIKFYVSRQPDEYYVYCLPPLLVKIGDKAGYHSFCSGMLKRFENTDHLNTVEVTCKSCLVIPPNRENLPKILKMSEKLDAVSSDNRILPHVEFVRSLAAYRDSDFHDAISWSERSLSRPQSKGIWYVIAQAKLVLAMSYARLNEEDKAQKTFVEATTILDRQLITFRSRGYITDWKDWLISEALRKEAQLLITDKISSSPEPATKLRTWVNNTGAFTLEAQLIEITQNRVKLLKQDGETIIVMLNDLSKADIDYAIREHSNITASRQDKATQQRDGATPQQSTPQQSTPQQSTQQQSTQQREEAYSVNNPGNTMLAMKVAALQVWFSQKADHLATSKRMLKWVNEATKPEDFERVSKLISLSSITDEKIRESALALAMRAVRLGAENEEKLPWNQMSLGMAEYRSGHYTEADNALMTAVETAADDNRERIESTSNFFRAMSLFQQGKLNEARTLFTETETKMRPLPTDEKNPLASNATHDHLITWLAYKEAKSLLAEVAKKTFSPSQAISHLTKRGAKIEYGTRNQPITLSLSHEQLTDDDLTAIGSLTTLKKVNLNQSYRRDIYREQHKMTYHPTLVTVAGFQNLCSLPALEELSTLKIDFSDDAMREISKLTTLKKLSFLPEHHGRYDGPNFTDKGLEYLQTLKQLEYLSIGGCPGFTDQGLVFVSNLSNLKFLNVTCTKVSDTGLENILKLSKLEAFFAFNCRAITNKGLISISKFTQLQRLDISGTHISDDGFQSIAKLNQLNYLSFSSTPISDKGLVYIENLSKMKSINLFGTRVTDTGLESLKKMRNLESFNLLRSQATPEGIEKLRQQLRNINKPPKSAS